MKTKACSKCEKPKPIDDFGRNARNLTRGAKDGKNECCKECVRTSAAAKRAKLPKKPRAPRKPRGKHARIQTVDENRPKVLGAIHLGHNSREAIEQHTKLSMDEIVDALADLTFETEELRIVRNREEPEFHPVASRDQLAA
jgi:hypothetical protein